MATARIVPAKDVHYSDIEGGYAGTDVGAYEFLLPLPSIAITNEPCHALVTDPLAVAGTNNEAVVGGMWISNDATAQSQVFSAASAWISGVVGIEWYTNMITVAGTNLMGEIASDTVVVVGVPEPVIAGAMTVIGYWLFVIRKRPARQRRITPPLHFPSTPQRA